jgi:hypothetical protein
MTSKAPTQSAIGDLIFPISRFQPGRLYHFGMVWSLPEIDYNESYREHTSCVATACKGTRLPAI